MQGQSAPEMAIAGCCYASGVMTVTVRSRAGLPSVQCASHQAITRVRLDELISKAEGNAEECAASCRAGLVTVLLATGATLILTTSQLGQ